MAELVSVLDAQTETGEKIPLHEGGLNFNGFQTFTGLIIAKEKFADRSAFELPVINGGVSMDNGTIDTIFSPDGEEIEITRLPDEVNLNATDGKSSITKAKRRLKKHRTKNGKGKKGKK